MSRHFSIFDAEANNHKGCGGSETFMWAILYDDDGRAIAWCSSRHEAEAICEALEPRAEASAHTEKARDGATDGK